MKRKSEFWIIETDSSGETEGSKGAIGPFESIAYAEKWLRQNSADTYLSADKSLRDGITPWAAPVHIVQVLKTVSAVPSVKVTVTLKNEK